MKITIPTNLSEITLDQWYKFQKVITQPDITEEVLELALVTVFCNLTLAQARQIPSKDIKETSMLIKRVLDFRPNFKQTIELDGIKFGFIPNLDACSAGEYIDIDKYMREPDMLAEALNVLYRPIVGKHKDLYNIEPYTCNTEHLDKFRKVDIDTAFGAKVFFYSLGSELLIATRQFLAKQENRQHLESVGVGISQFTQLLQETLSILKGQLSLKYTLS